MLWGLLFPALVLGVGKPGVGLRPPSLFIGNLCNQNIHPDSQLSHVDVGPAHLVSLSTYQS